MFLFRPREGTDNFNPRMSCSWRRRRTIDSTVHPSIRLFPRAVECYFCTNTYNLSQVVSCVAGTVIVQNTAYRHIVHQGVKRIRMRYVTYGMYSGV